MSRGSETLDIIASKGLMVQAIYAQAYLFYNNTILCTVLHLNYPNHGDWVNSLLDSFWCRCRFRRVWPVTDIRFCVVQYWWHVCVLRLRFTPFVKSGGEAFVLGNTQDDVSIPQPEKVTIIVSISSSGIQGGQSSKEATLGGWVRCETQGTTG